MLYQRRRYRRPLFGRKGYYKATSRRLKKWFNGQRRPRWYRYPHGMLRRRKVAYRKSWRPIHQRDYRRVNAIWDKNEQDIKEYHYQFTSKIDDLALSPETAPLTQRHVFFSAMPNSELKFWTKAGYNMNSLQHFSILGGRTLIKITNDNAAANFDCRLSIYAMYPRSSDTVLAFESQQILPVNWDPYYGRVNRKFAIYPIVKNYLLKRESHYLHGYSHRFRRYQVQNWLQSRGVPRYCILISGMPYATSVNLTFRLSFHYLCSGTSRPSDDPTDRMDIDPDIQNHQGLLRPESSAVDPEDSAPRPLPPNQAGPIKEQYLPDDVQPPRDVDMKQVVRWSSPHSFRYFKTSFWDYLLDTNFDSMYYLFGPEPNRPSESHWYCRRNINVNYKFRDRNNKPTNRNWIPYCNSWCYVFRQLPYDFLQLLTIYDEPTGITNYKSLPDESVFANVIKQYRVCLKQDIYRERMRSTPRIVTSDDPLVSLAWNAYELYSLYHGKQFPDLRAGELEDWPVAGDVTDPYDDSYTALTYKAPLKSAETIINDLILCMNQIPEQKYMRIRAYMYLGIPPDVLIRVWLHFKAVPLEKAPPPPPSWIWGPLEMILKFMDWYS